MVKELWYKRHTQSMQKLLTYSAFHGKRSASVDPVGLVQLMKSNRGKAESLPKGKFLPHWTFVSVHVSLMTRCHPSRLGSTICT
jgi:hypothetical protein